MTFEGQQLQGAVKIMEKLQVNIENQAFDCNWFVDFIAQSLTFQKITRIITAIDSQPMFDGGVIINVLGRLQVSIFLDHLNKSACMQFVGVYLTESFNKYNVFNFSQCDDDPPHAYSQVFTLKPLGGSFFCQHDMFRLNIHDTA